MPTSRCYPWWHGTFAAVATQPWSKTIVPSGCSMDNTGSVPCSPASMREAAETWLNRNTPQVLAMIDGLDQDTYTFARYMHSEVGSGTIEERVAVGEAAVNQAKLRAGAFGNWRSKLAGMLIPNGKYGAIHCPDAYCASLGKGSDCNCAGRWAATSRDPSVMAILLANLVLSGGSSNFANNAATQWGPEYLKNSDGSRMGTRTTRARVEYFVRHAASSSGGRYYWVGPLAGVDPWNTWLAFKGSALDAVMSEVLIRRGIDGLALNADGTPLRPVWPANLPVCGKPASKLGLVITTALGIGIGALAFRRFAEPR